MNLLVDTNIFLEILLEQEKNIEAINILSSVGVNDFFVTDFTLHSVAVKLFKEQLYDKYRMLMNDIVDQAGFIVVSLYSDDTQRLIEIAQRFHLDFDDAYQYCSAIKYNLTILSFDSDFDRTHLGRKKPSDLLRSL